MAELQLQPPLASDARAQAHLALVARLKALDLTPLLVYRIASLVDSAVLAMAWQWDVLNPLIAAGVAQAKLSTLQITSWDAIANIDTLVNIDLLSAPSGSGSGQPGFTSASAAAYRTLILLSTLLHSTVGTPAALQNALKNLGFANATILEGQGQWGGTSWPASQGWAVFRVVIKLAAGQTVPSGTAAQLVAVANYWKPARCWLDSIVFQNPALTDTLAPLPADSVVNFFLRRDAITVTDSWKTPAWPLIDAKTLIPYFNARYYCGGNITGGGVQPHANDTVVVNGVAIAQQG